MDDCLAAFTEDEIYRAHRLLMPDDQARAFAAGQVVEWVRKHCGWASISGHTWDAEVEHIRRMIEE